MSASILGFYRVYKGIMEKKMKTTKEIKRKLVSIKVYGRAGA